MPVITKEELGEIRCEYQPHYVGIDDEVVNDGEKCSKCESKMNYEGYKGFGEYRAFAVCSNGGCDYVEDF